MKITKKQINFLKEYGFEIVSKEPLKIIRDDEEYVGITAFALIDSYEYEESCDLSKLDSMNEDLLLLINADCNYADEFDMSDFTTMSVKEFKQIVKGLNDYDDEIEWSFGTNEDMFYNNGKELLGCLSYKVISQDEYDVLNNLFGGQFGNSNVFDHIFEILNDEDEDEDESNITKEDLRNIEKLKKFGWSVELLENDFVKYIHVNGDNALTDIYFMEALLDYLKRNMV